MVLEPAPRESQIPNRRVIVTGGAGYIGSFISRHLSQEGFEPIVLDNFSTGFPQNVRFGRFHRCDIRDFDSTLQIIRSENPSAIIHAAGSISVEESQRDPSLYFANNTFGTLNLLNVAKDLGIRNFIFSSTASVYSPSASLLTEKDPVFPVSNYGISKLMGEQMIQSFARSYDIRFLIFRYFNAAGADPHDRLGDLKPHKTHIIPNVIENALRGSTLWVFGNDYPTVDGTPVRDFIHVSDIARAHVLGLSYLLSPNSPSEIVNLATGIGTSVMQVIDFTNSVLRKSGFDPVKFEISGRRDGDVPFLIADPSKARRILGWAPRFDILDMIGDSLEFTNLTP